MSVETQNTDLVSEQSDREELALGEDERSDLRQRIIDVAREKFYSLGYSRVSMNEIAQELRISKKTLYREFETKEDLLRAIVFPIIQKNASDIDLFMSDPAHTFLQRIAYLMRMIAEKGASVSTILMQDVYTHAPRIWEEVHKFRKKRMAKLETVIEEGIKEGYLRTDISPVLAAQFYASAVSALVTPAVLAELPFTGAEVCTALMTILFEGLMTEKTRLEFRLGNSTPGTVHPG